MKSTVSFIVLLYLVGMACVPVRRETYIRVPDEKDPSAFEVTSTYADRDYQYQLRADDVLSIRVASSTPSEFNFLSYQNEEQMGNVRFNDPLLTGFEVAPDGTIFLPVIGKVELAGLTLDEARDKLREILTEYLEAPIVDVKLLSFQVTVLGEVESEGTFIVYNPELTILDVLARAGGVTDFADTERVKIVRDDGEILKVVYINVLEEDLLSSPYYYLQPNDVVTVGSVPSKNFLQYNAQYLTILLSGLSAVGIFFNIFR